MVPSNKLVQSDRASSWTCSSFPSSTARSTCAPTDDNYTVGADDAVRACEMIRARFHVPMHFNTFPIIKADGADFARKLEGKGLKGEVISVGRSVEIWWRAVRVEQF